jgi:hypothetical protein
MIKKLLLATFTTTILFSQSALAQNFYGVYNYSDKDFKDRKADQKIEFGLLEDAPTLTFYGVESAGEGCCAYFKVYADNLKTDDKGNISFTIGTRNLYLNKKSLDNKKNDGSSNATLKFKGKFTKNSLNLECKSDSGFDCYIEGKKMDFKKIKSY